MPPPIPPPLPPRPGRQGMAARRFPTGSTLPIGLRRSNRAARHGRAPLPDTPVRAIARRVLPQPRRVCAIACAPARPPGLAVACTGSGRRRGAHDGKPAPGARSCHSHAPPGDRRSAPLLCTHCHISHSSALLPPPPRRAPAVGLPCTIGGPAARNGKMRPATGFLVLSNTRDFALFLIERASRTVSSGAEELLGIRRGAADLACSSCFAGETPCRS